MDPLIVKVLIRTVKIYSLYWSGGLAADHCFDVFRVY